MTIEVPAVNGVDMTEGLAGVLAARLHHLWGTPVEVTSLRQLSGGASREAWDIEVSAGRHASTGREDRRLILLRNAADRAPTLEKDIKVEAAAMIAARQAGSPPPNCTTTGTAPSARPTC